MENIKITLENALYQAARDYIDAFNDAYDPRLGTVLDTPERFFKMNSLCTAAAAIREYHEEMDDDGDDETLGCCGNCENCDCCDDDEFNLTAEDILSAEGNKNVGEMTEAERIRCEKAKQALARHSEIIRSILGGDAKFIVLEKPHKHHHHHHKHHHSR